MAVMNPSLQPVSPNRRRRVRHKIQTPAYATFTSESQDSVLDLHEIVDISEDGIALQCHSPLEVEARVNLCLDLADCAEHIYTTGKVIWSHPSGRAGLRFSELSTQSLSRLREWLFVNVMAGVANGETQIAIPSGSLPFAPPRPDYSDTLAAVSAAQRQAEALGSDLAGALRLVAERAQKLVRASGAAIALAEADPNFMICRASSGRDAPPVGARLHVGSGFSGECVKAGTLLRCDDTDIDTRVDRESCRALGIRSMVAVPVRVGRKSIGILEVFSSQANTFSQTDGAVLQRLADTVLAAVNRAARTEDLPPLVPEKPAMQFAPVQGSVLFASLPVEEKKMEGSEEKISGGIHLPSSHLVLLICVAAAIALVLGYNLAPLIQSKLEQRGQMPMQTVLASSQPPRSDVTQASTPIPAAEAVSFGLLRQLALDGDPVSENALGLRYFQGDETNGIVRDEKQAFRWFARAADHGSLAAQAKLGFLYWGGRGVSKDINQAYFWTVLARARGDEESRDLAALLAASLTRAQAAAIELQADLWHQQHMAKKPGAGLAAGRQLRTSVASSR
jgi:GAF domain-containing protein/PilZ domain-containing protein/Sel1 repeat-containing protein